MPGQSSSPIRYDCSTQPGPHIMPCSLNHTMPFSPTTAHSVVFVVFMMIPVSLQPRMALTMPGLQPPTETDVMISFAAQPKPSCTCCCIFLHSDFDWLAVPSGTSSHSHCQRLFEPE